MTVADRWRAAALVLPVVTLLACGRPEPPAQRPPAATFSETTYEFGRVEQGAPVSHEFGFVNRGDLDLTVDRLRPGCACTAAVTGGRVIPAGGRGGIRVDVDTATLAGPQRQTVTVYTNDPAAPSILLTLTGEVRAEAVADPAALYVGHVRRGAAAPGSVAILTAESVTVQSVETDGGVLAASAGPLGDERAGQRLTVAIVATAPPGPFETEIRVRTSSTRYPFLRIPVVGIVDDDAEPDAAGFSKALSR